MTMSSYRQRVIIELFVKSPYPHPIFGPAFTPYPLFQYYMQSVHGCLFWHSSSPIGRWTNRTFGFPGPGNQLRKPRIHGRSSYFDNKKYSCELSQHSDCRGCAWARAHIFDKCNTESRIRAGRYGWTWFPITSCASGSTNCSPSFILRFSTFHDVSISRCDGYCAKQRNSKCLLHIHLQPELTRNNRGARAQPNNFWPSRFGCPRILDEGESPS